MKHLFRRLVCLSLALTMSGCIFFTTALGAETAQAPAAPVQSCLLYTSGSDKANRVGNETMRRVKDTMQISL